MLDSSNPVPAGGRCGLCLTVWGGQACDGGAQGCWRAFSCDYLESENIRHTGVCETHSHFVLLVYWREYLLLFQIKYIWFNCPTGCLSGVTTATRYMKSLSPSHCSEQYLLLFILFQFPLLLSCLLFTLHAVFQCVVTEHQTELIYCAYWKVNSWTDNDCWRAVSCVALYQILIISLPYQTSLGSSVDWSRLYKKSFLVVKHWRWMRFALRC